MSEELRQRATGAESVGKYCLIALTDLYYLGFTAQNQQLTARLSEHNSHAEDYRATERRVVYGLRIQSKKMFI